MKIENILIPFITIGIFLNLFFYLPVAKIINIPEYLIYFSLFFIMIMIYMLKRKKIEISNELLIWSIFYLFVNFSYIIFTGIGSREFKYLIPVITLVPVLIGLYLLYNLDNNQLIKTRKSIVIALIIAVPILVYDFLFPGDFVTTKILDNRAVAMYGNANIVGVVLILGLILTIDIIPEKYKSLFLFYIFIGVLVTFSRSNIMLYILILTIMSFQNKISKKLFLILVFIVISFMIFLVFDGNALLQEYLHVSLNENNINRLLFFIDNTNSDLQNISERQRVLQAALGMFADSPIVGNGFASTRLWEYPVGPHNTIALTLADFGLFGLLIVPLFLFATSYKVLRNGIKEHKQLAILFIVYYLYSCMFSHNMLDQKFNYVGAIIITILARKNNSKSMYHEN